MSNEVCYIVGGGPSLINKDLNLLANKDTIVINKSILHVPNPNYYISMDYTALRKIPFQNTDYTKIFVANMSILNEENGALRDPKNKLTYLGLFLIFDMICMARTVDGFGATWKDFRCGNHSGHSAIQFALLMGYTTIYLLGFDYVTNGGKTHFHTGYGQHPDFYNTYLNQYAVDLLGAFRDLTKFPGASIISCSKISLLNNVLPVRELEKVI
jgi:hypothetical protein